MDNLDLFKFSLENKDADTAAVAIDKVVITRDPENLNELIKANNRLIELFSAYKIAQEKDNELMQQSIIKDMVLLLRTEGINYSEFCNYWATHDATYSQYQKLSEDDKILFIENIISSYIVDRHDMYLAHGYSNTTLQVKCDSHAHKRIRATARG